MKKFLVLTLVLVMALSSTAFAAVKFSGSFTATAEQDHFKPFVGEYTLKPSHEVTISATASSVTEVDEEEVTNWDLTAALSLKDDKFVLGKYKLGLYDKWFTGYAWGNGQELSDKATYFSMILAGKAAGAEEMRARLIVHVMDYADVTFDFTAEDNLRAFVNGEVEGIDLGLAYARKNWTKDDKVSNTLVAQAGYDVPAGDIGVRLEGAVGVDIKEDMGLGFGLSADSDITEEINVNASVTHGNKNWVGDGKAVAAESTILGAEASYTEEAFKVVVDGSFTIKHKEGVDNENTLGLTGYYRMSDTLAYSDLFAATKWYTNDALAARVFVDLENVKLGEVGVDVASPVVDDMVWLKAFGRYGSYEFDNEEELDKMDGDKPVWKKKTDTGFKARLDAYIQATPKLVVKPYVAFEQIAKVFTVGTDASYKIGLSDTTLNFTVKRVTAEDIRESLNDSLIRASVKVTF